MNPADERLLAAARAAGGRIAAELPTSEAAADAARALQLVARALAPYLHEAGLRTSPLGPGWSHDIDAHVTTRPPEEELDALGWLPLDALLSRIGRLGEGRWAVVEGDRVIAALDLHVEPPPEPLAAVLSRAQRRGDVRVRDVLELRVRKRAGDALPDHPVVRAAADLEAALGGAELSPWRTNVSRASPVRLEDHSMGSHASASRSGSGLTRATGALRRMLPASESLRVAARGVRRVLRRGLRRRIVVGLNGVDGSGKSTLAAALRGDLARARIPTGKVWARPGMSSVWVSRVAKLSKRVLREDPTPGVRRVAADSSARLRSRHGVTGWVWSWFVTAAFLVDAWRQHLRSEGVVVFDRHALDAVVTLEVLYGAENRRLQLWAARALLPRASFGVYLDVSAEVAAARKPGDTIGEAAVRRQLARYHELLARQADVTVLEASATPQRLSLAILRALTGAREGHGSGTNYGLRRVRNVIE